MVVYIQVSIDDTIIRTPPFILDSEAHYQTSQHAYLTCTNRTLPIPNSTQNVASDEFGSALEINFEASKILG